MLDVNVNLTLRDAIAYNFYVDNLQDILEGCEDETSYSEGLMLLAKSSFLVAEVFCTMREAHIKDSSES